MILIDVRAITTEVKIIAAKKPHFICFANIGMNIKAAIVPII
jgi:hypothetical protein